MAVRAGPSGPFEPQTELLDWDMSATVELTVQPAGHEQGQYLVSGVAVVRVPPPAQNLERYVLNSAPNGAGAQVTASPLSPYGVSLGPGMFATDVQAVQSDGVDPIVVRFTPNGFPDPATRLDLYASATLLAVVGEEE